VSPLATGQKLERESAYDNALEDFQYKSIKPIVVAMPVAIWLPALFLLGLISMGLCFLFMLACEKI
jgi:hypothetical protein